MKKITRSLLVVLPVAAIVVCSNANLQAQKAAEIDKQVNEATAKLFASSDAAKNLSKVAKGILVFPTVKKAGFMVGGQRGEGALRVGGQDDRILQNDGGIIRPSGGRAKIQLRHVLYD